jgi:dipeptidase E
LDKDLIEMIKNGIFYIGASAGSIIVTPNIKIAEPWDPNDRKIKDLNGLGLVDFTVLPHYTKEEEAIAKNLEDELGIEVKRITDNQAVLVNGNEIELL